ncbi:MAG TPA: hypothetical protein VFK38_03135 [Candidatus Limnocylindrales bacterium]|nr:hypothetical protein [Candidatus Limnocylindrales bacterium]
MSAEPDAIGAIEAGVDTPCSAEGTARSEGETNPAQLSITNHAAVSITLYRLDESGRRADRRPIDPGARHIERTYESAAWLLADAGDRCMAIVHAPADLEIDPVAPQPSGGPLFPTPAPSGQPSTLPTDEATAQASLLTTADLPAGSAPQGVDPIDLSGAPIFSGNGGLRALRQDWKVPAPYVYVLDFRAQFRTAENAAAFLAAAEGGLAETKNGFARSTALPAVGDNGRVYAASVARQDGRYQDFIFLFTTGNLLAKVFVAAPEGTPAASAASLAAAAQSRMATAIGGGSAGGETFPNEAERALLSHVPPAIAAGCERAAEAPTGALASVECRSGSGAGSVAYSAFADRAAMDAVYDASLSNHAAETTGESCQTGPAKGPWSIQGTVYGRLACYPVQNAGFIIWTDERLSIYSSALRADHDWGALYRFWANEAGPIE